MSMFGFVRSICIYSLFRYVSYSLIFVHFSDLVENRESAARYSFSSPHKIARITHDSRSPTRFPSGKLSAYPAIVRERIETGESAKAMNGKANGLELHLPCGLTSTDRQKSRYVTSVRELRSVRWPERGI